MLAYPACLDDFERSFEIVGDGGEVDLDGGPSTSLRRAFGEAAPSHSAKSVASFPGAEYLFDPAPYPVDRLIPFSELLKRLLFVATPHAGGDKPPATPQFLFFVTEIPLTPAGKFARYILRQRAVEWYVRRALGPSVEARITCTDIAAKTVDLQWRESVDHETTARVVGDLARVGLWVNVVPASSHLPQFQDETTDENKEIS